MQGLGDTVAMLARARKLVAAHVDMGAADGARMQSVPAFGDNPGGLRMFSYAPDGLPQGAPLVVVLHGCTQTAEAYAANAGWLELADRHGFVVVAPEQQTANNANRCFNWFLPGDIERDSGEAASIAAMVHHAVRAHGLDRARIFVSGLSAGGAMTAVMLATYPDLFAAGAIIAGLPYGSATSVQDALRAMHAPSAQSASTLGDLVRTAAPRGGAIPKVSVWHGGADHTVAVANAKTLVQQWVDVHGLSESPDETARLPDGRVRSLWRGPAGGEAVIELNLISGMGHGTPLCLGQKDSVGAAAPFMLDAGVASSVESLRFWGVAAQDSRPSSKPRPRSEPIQPEPEPEPIGQAALGQRVLSAVSAYVPADIESVIAKALRAAGLLK